MSESHGWWECEECGVQNDSGVDVCLCGAKLEDQPDSARPLMTQRQAENLEALANQGLQGKPRRKQPDKDEGLSTCPWTALRATLTARTPSPARQAAVVPLWILPAQGPLLINTG